jgi:hypothetical protein
MMPYKFLELSEKEKELYITGVLDGQSFLMYGPSDPNLGPLVRCIESLGLKTVRGTTENVLVLNPEELKNPMPWAIARALGILCKEYREKR